MSYHKIAVLNGHFLPVREVRLNPTCQGVLSGWGVYTSIRLYEGHPFNVESHLSRLRKDASKVGIPLPQGFDSIGPDLMDLAKRNGAKDGIGRVTLLGGGEVGGTDASNLLILTAARVNRDEPESLWVAPYRQHTLHPLLGVKITSNGLYIQSRREARRHKCDEALLLNDREEVVEVSSGNLFWVKDGALYTPALDCGCVDGSSRNLILKVADHEGITVHDGAFPLEAVLDAEEVFLSSVSREVQPVSTIGERDWGGEGGAVSGRLQAGFQKRVDSWLTKRLSAQAAAEVAEDE